MRVRAAEAALARGEQHGPHSLAHVSVLEEAARALSVGHAVECAAQQKERQGLAEREGLLLAEAQHRVLGKAQAQQRLLHARAAPPLLRR